MKTSPRRITIIGGGIGGLTLAAALDPSRFEVTLLEADPRRRQFGAGVGLWNSARRALRRIGAWSALSNETGESPATGTLHDIHGRPLTRLKGLDLHIVERPRLLSAIESVVPASVQQVTAQVDDPTSVDGDLVIGADGVRSRVRGLVYPRGAERIETPYVALRGIAPAAQTGDLGEYWGPGQLFGLAPMADGRGYWFTTHRSSLGPEPLDVDAVADEARVVFASAAPAVRQLLKTAGHTTGVNATRMWIAPPMPRYASGRYVVIGDAAHASLPNLGRGACDAVLDAVSLARVLNKGGSLAAWQARRLPFTQGARVAASGIMRMALLDSGHGVRNAALSTVGRVL
ncbi:MAG: FAD-dependent monooxygenase [Dermatophilus congolensis]|nr:FAD-dependent monooxygenase [Dermatophilus congolensis]